MTWDYNDHEGRAATIVEGGHRVASYAADGMVLEDGTSVPDSDAIGWLAECSCGWKAPLMFERVSDPATSLKPWQVFNAEGGWAPKEVSDICYAEWLDHIRPEIGLAAVRQAAQDHRLSGEKLDNSVAEARQHGVSWADIGKAVGVTRQATNEWWMALSNNRGSKTPDEIKTDKI